MKNKVIFSGLFRELKAQNNMLFMDGLNFNKIKKNKPLLYSKVVILITEIIMMSMKELEIILCHVL